MASRLWHLGKHFRRDPSRTTLDAGSPVFILGIRYNDISTPEVYETFTRHFESIVWCSYRRDFPPIRKSILLSFSLGITADSGWGCMMRSGQMMLANGLIFHYLGRGFRRPRLRVYETADAAMALVQEGSLPRQYDLVLDWFFDDPSRRYSIHRIVEAGVRFGKQPAQWHGPSTICNVLERLVNYRGDPLGGEDCEESSRSLRRKRRRRRDGDTSHAVTFDAMEKDVRLYCGRDATLYVDELLSLAHGPPLVPPTPQSPCDEDVVVGRRRGPGFHAFSVPVSEDDSGGEDDYIEGEGSGSPSSEDPEENHLLQQQPDVFTPLLIFISIRLGVEHINPCYLPPLQRLLSFPYTLGIAGGRPRHSLYFVGFQGEDFLFLDPHTEQKTGRNPNTYHTSVVRSIKFETIDPSMAVGFYIPTQEDLFEFLRRARQELTECSYPIFGIQDTRPNYLCNDVVRVLDD